MTMTCTVCRHPDHTEIDKDLLAGTSLRNIVKRYAMNGTLSIASLSRHKESCISETLAKAHEAGELVRADDLMSQLRSLQTRTEGILDAAEEAGDLRTAVSAVRELRGHIETLAKLTAYALERARPEQAGPGGVVFITENFRDIAPALDDPACMKLVVDQLRRRGYLVKSPEEQLDTTWRDRLKAKLTGHIEQTGLSNQN